MGTKTVRFAQRLCAALCLCALLLFVAAPPAVQASSQSGSGSGSSQGQGSSDASGGDGSDASGTEPEAPVPEGQGLYLPEDFEPKAEAVCLVNEDTGLVAYEKNADTPMAAASLVKMMTVMLAYERIEDLDNTLIEANQTWIFDELTEYRLNTGSTPSHADIRKGETLTARELLYAALLPSAGEAALLLADYTGGAYMTNFLYMMNARAKSLGCTGTTFVDCHGLSEENVTTARDMVLITRAFMSYPELVEIAATTVFEMPAHEKHAAAYNIHTTNRLLVQTSPYYKAFPSVAGAVVAGKTGSLSGWQNFASKAQKGGESYICVVLHSPNEADVVGVTMDPVQNRPALYESAQLYDWAFANLTVRSALDTEEPVTEIRVLYSSDVGSVRLLPSGDIRALLPKQGELSMIQRRYDLPKQVEAPIEAGQDLGSVTLLVAGKEIGSVRLAAEQAVSRNSTLYALQRTGGFFTSTYFRVLLVLVLVFGGGYAAFVYYAHQRRQKTGQKTQQPPRRAAPKGAQGGRAAPGAGQPATVHRARTGTAGKPAARGRPAPNTRTSGNAAGRQRKGQNDEH